MPALSILGIAVLSGVLKDAAGNPLGSALERLPFLFIVVLTIAAIWERQRRSRRFTAELQAWRARSAEFEAQMICMRCGNSWRL
jgi:hypothetical protein